VALLTLLRGTASEQNGYVDLIMVHILFLRNYSTGIDKVKHRLASIYSRAWLVHY